MPDPISFIVGAALLGYGHRYDKPLKVASFSLGTILVGLVVFQ